MKTICAALVLASFCSQLTFATGVDGNRTAEPGWKAVRALEPAAPITVTTADRKVTRVFLAADDTSVTLLNLGGVPERVRRTVLEVARMNADALAAAATGGPRLLNDFRIGPDGVFLRDVRLGDREWILERLPRDEVIAITLPPARHGSTAGAAGGAALGALIGGFAGYWMFGERQGNAGYVGTFGMMIGVPIAVGYGLWHADSEVIEKVVYTRVNTTDVSR